MRTVKINIHTGCGKNMLDVKTCPQSKSAMKNMNFYLEKSSLY